MNLGILEPEIGLGFWSLLFFLILVFILGKFAWKPIMKAIKEREDSINQSLQEAEKARAEMENLTANNEKLLKEARIERDAILKEARDLKEKIVSEAKDQAKTEAAREIENAKQQIQSEKMAALTEIRNQAGNLAVEVAEKLLRKEMENRDAQKALASQMIDEMNLN